MSKSILGTTSAAIVSVLSTVTTTAASVEKAVDVGNIYVNANHRKLTKTVKEDAIIATARHHKALSTELSDDAELKRIYDELHTTWDE